MSNIGFSNPEIEEVQQILVAIINMGNIQFLDGKQGSSSLEPNCPFAAAFGTYLGLEGIK